MNSGLNVVSCVFAAISGLCFVSGMAILSGGKESQNGYVGRLSMRSGRNAG